MCGIVCGTVSDYSRALNNFGMIRLTENDRRVLQFSMLRADWPVSRIASALSLKEHVVRNSLQKLKAHSLIRETCAVDQSFFGLTTYNVLFSLRERTREAHQALGSFLVSRKGVGWAVEVGGSYQYELSLVADSPLSLATLFHDMHMQIGVSVAQKALAVEYRQVFFGLRFAGIEIGTPASFSLCVATRQEEKILDDTDRRLVQLIANSEEFSVSAFARALGAPATTVSYKMRRLHNLGVLSAPIFNVKYLELGLERTHLLISSRRTDEEFVRILTKFCEQTPGVYAVISSIGSWDFKVVIVAENRQQTKSVVDVLSNRFGELFSAISVVPCFESIHVSWHSQEKDAVHEKEPPLRLLKAV